MTALWPCAYRAVWATAVYLWIGLASALAGEGFHALDLFTWRPAPFYQGQDGRIAAFAAQGDVACWVVGVQGLAKDRGHLSDLQLQCKADWPRPVRFAAFAPAPADQWAKRPGGVPKGLVRVKPQAPVGEPLAVFLEVPKTVRAGVYLFDLALTFKSGKIVAPLTLKALPFELPEDKGIAPTLFGKADLTDVEYLNVQRLGFNRYASLLRLRADDGVKAPESLLYGLSRSALNEAASVPFTADEDAGLEDKRLVKVFLDDAAEAATTAIGVVPSASPWDLRRWRAAWLYMRLCRAGAGFPVNVAPAVAQPRLDFRFGPDRPEPRRPRVLCPQTAKPPEIDGALSDKCWVSAAAVDEFGRVTPESDAARRATQVRFCHDGQTVYVGVLAGGSPPESLAANLKPVDKASFEREMVRIRLSPVGGVDLELFLDPFGSCIPRTVGTAPYTGKARASVKRFDAYWVAEAALPLGETARVENDWWTVTVERWVPGKEVALYRYPDQKATGRRSADFAFERSGLFLARFDMPGPGLGFNALRVTIHNPTAASVRADAFLAIRFEDGKPDQFTFPFPPVPAGTFVRIELPYRLKRTGPCSAVLFLKERASQKVLARVMRMDMIVPEPMMFSGQRIFTNEDAAQVLLNLDVTQTCMNKVILRVSLSPPKARKPLGEVYINAVKSDACVLKVPLAGMKGHTYTLSCEMRAGDEVVAKSRFGFTVMPHFLEEDADGR